MKRFFVACLLGSLSLHAVAARPFVTDDARLTNAGSCQLESWARLYRDSHETWALPACNPTGNFEVTAGGGYARSDNSQGTNDYVHRQHYLVTYNESGRILNEGKYKGFWRN